MEIRVSIAFLIFFIGLYMLARYAAASWLRWVSTISVDHYVEVGDVVQVGRSWVKIISVERRARTSPEGWVYRCMVSKLGGKELNRGWLPYPEGMTLTTGDLVWLKTSGQAVVTRSEGTLSPSLELFVIASEKKLRYYKHDGLVIDLEVGKETPDQITYYQPVSILHNSKI